MFGLINVPDVINSKDINEYIKNLEDSASYLDYLEKNELKSLLEFQEEGKQYNKFWDYGQYLLNDDFFTPKDTEYSKWIDVFYKDQKYWLYYDPKEN